MKHLIVIDGNSLMHRAYYALPSMTTKDGFPTGALHGFLSMLLKLTEREPDYLIVAFDMHGPTFRHESYDAYKAGRRETPDDLRTQFPVLKELLIQMGVCVCECPRYEADDILGTFAKRCEESGIDALLVTGDRDALQLIGEHTHVLMTKRGITDTIEYDVPTLKEAYGLSPDRMRDLKGLMGDSSDNIPGIPGVGEKTAQKLLAEFGDLETVLANAENIKGKLGERIAQNKDAARLSYWLGTICTDAPIEIGIAESAFVPGRMSAAYTRLIELELRAIAARLPKMEGFAPVETAERVKAQRIEIGSTEQLQTIFQENAACDSIALDLGDTISFAFSPETSFVLSAKTDLFSAVINEKDVFEGLRPFLEGEQNQVIAFDAKRLRHILDRFGIALRANVFDAMIADYLLNATRPAPSFEALCQRVDPTAHADPAMLFAMRSDMLRALEQADMTRLYSQIELPLSIVLYSMEREGFRVNETMLLELQTRFQTQASELEAKIYELTGEKFNILSPKQLGDVLFTKLALPTQRKTKSGYSTDADSLEALRELHPSIPLILQYRFITKLKSTFVDGLLNARDPRDGRVRTQFNQCITATGRISSTEPNLQNIPVRTEQGREIRKAFIASEGNVLVGADYSQIELRLLAHISGDEGMIEAFKSGRDFHRFTASEVFGVPFDEVNNELRSAAKAVNFGIVYGISDFGLARNLDISVKQASEYIKLYFSRYPRVKAYLTESVENAKRRGYAVTLFERRRPMPELTSGNFNTRSFGERVAMNMPIQGAAADIIKLAMVRVSDALTSGGFEAKLILQVHDELILDVPRAEAEAVAALVREQMEGVVSLSIPLEADVKIGESWYDTK